MKVENYEIIKKKQDEEEEEECWWKKTGLIANVIDHAFECKFDKLFHIENT